VKKRLACWPAFPIALKCCRDDENDINAAIPLGLEYRDRICHIEFHSINLGKEKVAKAMRKPFPALKSLLLRSEYSSAHTIPPGLLGGSAPRLQEITFKGMSFPALPKLLLKAHDLVSLEVSDMPWTGFLLPENIVKGAATATRLERLCIGFNKPSTRYITRRLPLAPRITRAVLPSLISLQLHGTRDYLEDFVARVDVPQLRLTSLSFTGYFGFGQNHQKDVPELLKFMERSEGVQLTQFKRVDVTLNGESTFHAYHEAHSQSSPLKISITDIVTRRSVFHVTQLLSQFSLFHVDYLHIRWDCRASPLMKPSNSEWLELFRPFTAVRALHVCENLVEQFSQSFESATTELGILPALELLCLESHSMSFDKYVIAWQLSGHLLVTIVDTLREFDEILESDFLHSSK